MLTEAEEIKTEGKNNIKRSFEYNEDIEKFAIEIDSKQRKIIKRVRRSFCIEFCA